MKMASVKKNFIYNTFYQLLAIMLPLITTPYISRVLGPDKIGEYSYAYSISYYFVMFIMLGLNNYGNRTIAMVRNDKEKLSKTFYSIYGMQFFTATIVIFFYIVYLLVFSNTLMAWIMIFYVISAGLDINWFFFGLEEFKLTVIRNTIVKLLTTVCIFLFIKNKEDVYLYGMIMVLGLLLSQLLIWPFVRKYVKFTRVTINDIILHIKPNLILFIPVIAISLYKMMDKIMLGSMSSMMQVGFYESSEKIIQVPMALINSLGTVMLPKMSNLIANNNKKEASKYMSNSILFVMFLSTSMCFGIMGIADIFVPLFYGNGYEQCIVLFQILLPSCMFLAFANVIRTQYLIPYKQDKIYITSVSLGAIINLIINLLLIPKLASTGAAVGTLFAEAAVCIYQAVKVRKEINTFKYFKNSIFFIISGLIMYIVLRFIKLPITSSIFNLFIKIIIGVFLYLIPCISWLIIIKIVKKSKSII